MEGGSKADVNRPKSRITYWSGLHVHTIMLEHVVCCRFSCARPYITFTFGKDDTVTFDGHEGGGTKASDVKAMIEAWIKFCNEGFATLLISPADATQARGY
jgi:hypothetical protein